MAKSHTFLGCVTAFLTAAAPLAAEAPFTNNDDTPVSTQQGWFSPFKAASVLSSVAVFTALLKANDNSAAPSHSPAVATNGPSFQNQAGSDDANDNGSGGAGNGIENENENDNNAATVPEPGTLMLVGSGLVGLAGVRRRKQA